jgi:hypothetical protein
VEVQNGDGGLSKCAKLTGCRFASTKFRYKSLHLLKLCGPGSSIGIATDYGLEGPEIATRWGRDFAHLSRPALGPTQPPVQWVPDLSPG